MERQVGRSRFIKVVAGVGDETASMCPSQRGRESVVPAARGRDGVLSR